MESNSSDLNKYDKYQYLKAAKELQYPEEVFVKLRQAETRIECDRIMVTARRKYL